MTQKEFIGYGAITSIQEVLNEVSPKNIFLVRGKHSFASSGAQAALGVLLSAYDVVSFYDFPQSPKVEDVFRGLSIFRKHPKDCVIAVGGGSVIDMAKLIRHFDAPDVVDLASLREKIQKEEVIQQSLSAPLIAVPTTSGSGSEATHFAVIYIEHTKYSVADVGILPSVAIVDPELTLTLPPRLTAITGMDALSQAIESYWSVRSSEVSKDYARQSIKHILPSLRQAVIDPDRIARQEISIGAHLAGNAINISRTTAPHAISYPMTSLFGVPHGHAVALTLGTLFAYNAGVTDADLGDSRGKDYVKKTLDELCTMFGCSGAEEVVLYIAHLMSDIGLETNLWDVGIRTNVEIKTIIDHVNVERLKNNPRVLTADSLENILRSLVVENQNHK